MSTGQVINHMLLGGVLAILFIWSIKAIALVAGIFCESRRKGGEQ